MWRDTQADLVVNISDIHDEVHVVAKVIDQYSPKDILCHIVSTIREVESN